MIELAVAAFILAVLKFPDLLLQLALWLGAQAAVAAAIIYLGDEIEKRLPSPKP